MPSYHAVFTTSIDHTRRVNVHLFPQTTMHFNTAVWCLKLCPNDNDLYPTAQFVFKVTAPSMAADSHLLYTNITAMNCQMVTKLSPYYVF